MEVWREYSWSIVTLPDGLLPGAIQIKNVTLKRL